ncbi:unnamed protein product, partial [Mesorhabditis belari]|uniref:Uncharacterized protein n=1 Tax=Mesorhabditis belari TaxID=2138241 RepID=A0AAF3FN02_9BILA
MRDLYVKSGQGFVLIYSVEDPHSLRDLLPIYRLITHLKQGQTVPMVIVGNKSDLHTQRAIPTDHGKNLAREWGCSFYEASAKLNHNVQEIFTDVCRQIERWRLSQGPVVKKRTLRIPGSRPDSDKKRYGKNRYTSQAEKSTPCCSVM